MRLADRVAVVTGAGSGIGRAVALLFAKEGARVALVDRDEAGLAGTLDAIEAAGGQALTRCSDAGEPGCVSDVVRLIILIMFPWLCFWLPGLT